MRERRRERILIVEYNETIAQLIKAALEKEGYIVWIAPNGVKGYEIYRNKHPDMLITNIPVPLMNGLELVKKIRIYNRRIRILFLSDLTDPDDMMRGYQAGGNEYMRKPFEMAELMLRVRVLLQYKFPNRTHSSDFSQMKIMILLLALTKISWETLTTYI